MPRHILSGSIAVGLLVAAASASPARAEDSPGTEGERSQVAVALVSGHLAPPSRPAPPVESSPEPPREADARRSRKLLSLGDASLVDIAPKLKLEARAVTGDLDRSPDKTIYVRSHDSYIRKIKFGAGGHFLTRGKYALTWQAENLGRDRRKPTLELDRAYADYSFAEALTVRAGRAQLPLSRGVLLSSSSVFIDETKVTDEASDVFEDDDQLQLQLSGRLLGGVLSYWAAIANGWSQGAEIDDFDQGKKVRRGQPLYVVRAELAIPGFAQPLPETRPGNGRRISLGGSLSTQRGIRYAGVEGHEHRMLAAADVTARIDSFSAIVEGQAWQIDSTLPKVGRVRPWGWYAQTGWYVHALRVEPIVRWEHLQEREETGAAQEAISGGATLYLHGGSAKLQANFVHRSFGSRSDSRLELMRYRDLLEFGAELSF